MKLFPGAIMLSIFKLQRLTSVSFLILLFFLSNQSAFSQSFLKVGNRWDYIHGWWWNGSSDADTASYYAVADTTFPNGKTYYSVLPHIQLFGDFIRADSAGIWHYDTACSKEWLYYSYNDSIGQTRFIPGYGCDTSQWSQEVNKTWDTTEVIFGDTVRLIVFEHQLNMEDHATIEISPGLGFINESIPGWNANYYTSLMGCIISDTVHGNLFTGVEDDYHALTFLLEQNYPNPFNPSTSITYSTGNYSNVVIKIFDVLGNEIETLVNEGKPAGKYEITWNAAGFSSGVYFYQLKAGDIIKTKKMILMR